MQFVPGTYGQYGLGYDLIVELLNKDGKIVRKQIVKGEKINDNAPTSVEFPAITGTKNEHFVVRISAPNAQKKNGLSIWMADKKRASLNFLPAQQLPSSFIAFHPLDYSENIVPNDFLVSPFPYNKAKKIPWDITPASDYSPFFNMTRRSLHRIKAEPGNATDRNTAFILNTQMEGGFPKDWIHLIVVAAVSLIFSLIFIAVPLLRSNVRHTTWSGMSRDIIYFACLGLGFIMIEVVLIQLFFKLIGYPVHTFVLIISTMLLGAGLGSLYSQKFLRLVGFRVQMIFILILCYGIGFTLAFEELFYFFLSFPLPVRLLCGVVMVAPLAFFMGMPFPIGILGLSENNAAAVSWAWALNGFFTVLGGYLAIVVAIMSNFKIVLALALLIYVCAMIVVRRKLPAIQDSNDLSGAEQRSVSTA